MKKIMNVCLCALIVAALASCSSAFDRAIEKGQYKSAEKIVKNMHGEGKYECAETLIREYLEIEEYDRAVYVYEYITPEHCSNRNLDYPSLYCHGATESYELNVTSMFRKTFTATGDYDKVWQYSVWKSDDDTGYNAEAYYRFMSEVILYLCSQGNKPEANKFLNHYVFWFDSRIDNNSYYAEQSPEFSCDLVRTKLQRIINTY